MNNQSNEKFTLQDFLTTQKQVTGTYNVWAGECQNNELRSKFIHILEDEHAIQNEIFVEMKSRGFYPVKAGEQQELDQIKQKFC